MFYCVIVLFLGFFQTMKKNNVFPAIIVFWDMLVKRDFIFMFYAFVLVLFLLLFFMMFASSLNNEVLLFYVCVVCFLLYQD